MTFMISIKAYISLIGFVMCIHIDELFSNYRKNN